MTHSLDPNDSTSELSQTPPTQPNKIRVSRRYILNGVGAIGAGTFTAWLGTNALGQQLSATAIAATHPPAVAPRPTSPGMSQTQLTPDAALQQLIAGNDRFIANQRQNLHQDVARITEIAARQTPFAAILCCADSRVPPEIVFDQGLGDLFVVRVAGNLATVEDIASEEYAAAILGTPLLLVLGHERCGAVDAALKGGTLPGKMNTLVNAIQPAIAATQDQPGDRLTNAVKANVMNQVNRLRASPVLTDLMQQGKLNIIGGYYDLDTGKVEILG